MAAPNSRAKWIVVPMVCGAGALLAALPRAQGLGWAGLLIGALLTGLLAAVDRPARGPLVIGFVLRSLLVVYVTFVAPGIDADPDGYMWRATEWSQGGFAQALGHFESGAYLYSWIVGLVFSVTGTSVFLIRALSALLGTLTVWLSFRLARALWGEHCAAAVAWLAALFPNLVLHSALAAGREPLAVCLATLALVSFTGWQKDRRLGQLIVADAAIFTAAMLHSGFVVTAAALVLTALVSRPARAGARGYAAIPQAFGLVLLSVPLWLMASTGFGLEKVGGSLDGLSTERVLWFQEGGAIGRAAFPGFLILRTPLDYVIKTPLRVMYFLFAPFPWMLRTQRDVLGLVDSVMYAWLALRLYQARRKVWADARARAMLMVVVATLLGFSMVVSNYGAAVRHRAKLLPSIAAVAAVAVVRGQPARMRHPRVTMTLPGPPWRTARSRTRRFVAGVSIHEG